jgi:hypothetical protein
LQLSDVEDVVFAGCDLIVLNTSNPSLWSNSRPRWGRWSQLWGSLQLDNSTITTPVSVFEHGAVNILYQEGDKLENFVVNVPVFALDEKGMPVK